MGPSLMLTSALSLVLLHTVPAAAGMPERGGMRAPHPLLAGLPNGLRNRSTRVVAVPPKPPEQGTPPAAPPPTVAPCKLVTPEAPRGGRLEVEGGEFGKTPVV